MIFDCFTLRDELDLLELRLQILDDYVDKFVISEANYTHKGNPKPYYFLENQERFAKWSDKIIYLPVDFEEDIKHIDFSIIDPHTNIDKSRWSLENKQRLALLYGIKTGEDNDVVIISDVDEIPNLDVLPTEIPTPMSFIQKFYYYYVNNESIGPKDKFWAGSVVCLKHHLSNYTPQNLRDFRWQLPPLPNGGWHWSYLGGEDFIKTKLNSIVEAESVLKDFNLSQDDALLNFKNLKDLYNREGMNFQLVDLSTYPEHILKIIKQYPKFIYYAI